MRRRFPPPDDHIPRRSRCPSTWTSTTGSSESPQQQLDEAHRADLAIQAEEGVDFERAWLDPDSGKVFCLASGPSKEAVMRIHERTGHPARETYELAYEV